MHEEASDTESKNNSILHHPRGLLVLAGTELWDQISFCGMQAILVLYMVERLFLPGHIEKVAGFDAVRSTIERVTGHLTNQGLAVQIFGLYAGLIYFTPPFGGFVGDRILGRTRSVVLGALLMAAGHFCMAFEKSFLFALLLLILGAGLLRGNLASQVADLYQPSDQRRAVAFQLYTSTVSLGGFIAPVVTGLLSQVYGWDIAFAFAGFGMLIGLVIYLRGQGTLARADLRSVVTVRAPLQPAERSVVFALLTLVPITTLFWVAQSQIWNTYNLWVRDTVDLRVGEWTMPVPWLQSLDGLAPFLSLPPLLLLWKWQGRRGREPDELTRMTVGLFIFAASVMILAVGQWIKDPTGKTPLILPVLFHFTSNIGWLYFSPSAISLFAGASPRSMRGTMTGVNTLSMFFGSAIGGRIGSLYGTIPSSQFWFIHAILPALGGVLLWLSSGFLRKILMAGAVEQRAGLGAAVSQKPPLY